MYRKMKMNKQEKKKPLKILQLQEFLHSLMVSIFLDRKGNKMHTGAVELPIDQFPGVGGATTFALALPRL